MLEVFIKSILSDYIHKSPDESFEDFVKSVCDRYEPFAGTIQQLTSSNKAINSDFMEEGRAFAKWYDKNLRPSSIKQDKANIEKWAYEYEKLRRIDGKTKQDIALAVEWARTEEFWSKNFLSPMKLRQKDKQGVMYIDVFLEKAKEAAPKVLKHKTQPYNPVTGG